ncbi:hypothetical protein [Megalodesulfovibrio paquesii]
MPGIFDIATQLTAVEEKLHFLHQTITACKGAPLDCAALAGLAHIVSDLVGSVQEVRRDVDALRGREELHPPILPAATHLCAEDAADLDPGDAQEQRRHGAS